MPPRPPAGKTHRFTCQQYPNLYLRNVGVRFERGEATVTDPGVAKAVRALPEHYGIQEVGGSEPADDPDTVHTRAARSTRR